MGRAFVFHNGTGNPSGPFSEEEMNRRLLSNPSYYLLPSVRIYEMIPVKFRDAEVITTHKEIV